MGEDTEVGNKLLQSPIVALVSAPGMATYCISTNNTLGPYHMNGILRRAIKHFSEEEAEKMMQENQAFEWILE